MNRSVASSARPLGVPRPPRRGFLAPPAVRLAQFCLVVRLASVVGLVLAAGVNVPATTLALPGSHPVVLPGGALWNALAAWILAGSAFETALVLRLGTLRAGSRRVVLLVESVVITATGMYAAAGLKVALIPMVAAIAAVVLLRLDHVRHSFNRARAERRLVGRALSAQLFSGYALPDPTAAKRIQEVGYRIGVDCPRVDDAGSEMSRK